MTTVTTVTNDPRRELSDRAVAILRTSVPVWWGSLVTWLLVRLATLLPAELLEPLEALLRSEPAKALATVAVTLVWYLLWRWLAPRIPDWLLRLALGSTRTPVYPGTRDAREFDELLEEKARAGLGGDRLTTPLTDDEVAFVRDMREVEGRDGDA